MSTTNNSTLVLDHSKTNFEDYIKACGSKSAAIRRLAGEGLKRGDIARYLNIRYQHVRNVLITPVKKVQG